MKITILGGKDEIGGNKVLLEHKGTKILLDFGMSFKQASKYFAEFLQPRKCVGLNDYFEFGLLPDIKGLYREDYLEHMGRSSEKREIDAILLSHAHADHAEYIDFIRTDIPIYCTEATKLLLKTLEETGNGNEFINVCEAFKFYKNTKGELSRVTKRHAEYVKERHYTVLHSDKKMKIGSLEIEMAPVDHSLPGACGFIIYSDEGNLVYTGDIRFHGYAAEFSKNFVTKAAAAKPKWLLCEGTRFGSDEKDSEEQVRKDISQYISKSTGLVFVEHPIRDLYRVQSIFLAAKENKRALVVPPKLAYIIREMGDLCPFKLSDVKILVPLKSWGLICKKNFTCEQIAKDYDIWEREFLSAENKITYQDLQKNPEKYVVSINMYTINQLVDIQPKNAIWIKSSCEPFCEEMELDENRKKNWLEHFNVKEYFAHASGHASGPELKAMIKQINAGKTTIIHTEHHIEDTSKE